MDRSPEADQRLCPTAAALAAFLCDELPPPAMDEIGAHVSSCQHCDAAVRRMDEATDVSLKRLRHHLRNGVSSSEPVDPEYQRMMAAAHALPPTLVQTEAPLPPPTQLGRYRIGERLGQGGMGTVYRAEHVRLKKKVAVKILSENQTRDPRAVARFQLEMEVIGRLDHPNIVRATDAGEADGLHFLVMELVDGANLAKLVHQCGPLPVAVACELIRQTALGLQHAHEHGLVHRDVKPSNLMLSTIGQVKVLDLGLALLRASGPNPGDLTGIGEVMGTAEYMAPEQWAETHAVDIRADIYSLGCTLYALLTGDPPFPGSGRKSFMRLMSAHQHDPVPPITERRTDVPAALADLLERMLAKRPDARPATPGAVAIELEHLAIGADLSGLSVSSSPDAKTIAERGRLVPFKPTPTPTPTPLCPLTPPAQPAKRRRSFALALVVLAGATGLGTYTALAPAPGNANRGPAPKTEPPDPKKWRNLLTERPGERLWVSNNLSLLNHDSDKETLSIQTTRSALFRLGETSAQGYKLQIGFQQVRWQGGIGVYFGGRPDSDSNTFKFQFIHLRYTNVKDHKYVLGRSCGYFSLDLGTKPEVVPTGFASADLAAPASEEQLLELEVRPAGLAIVRWNGIACPTLVNESALASARKYFPNDPHLAGEFGIYCNGTTGTVLTARYVFIE